MPRIEKRYERLALTDDYLKDPLLMALAWKKSHHYIRTTKEGANKSRACSACA